MPSAVLFYAHNTRKDYDASVSYRNGEATIIREDGYETNLKDKMPELEI